MIIPTEETNHYRYIVESLNERPIRDILIDRGFSSRLISSIKKNGRLLLNNKDVFFIEKAKKDDIIDIYLPKEHLDTIPVEGPLDIIYEDSEVLVVNKPEGLVVHPTHDYQENTLANYVANYFKNTNQDVKVRFVNRLDRDTTGIVIIAKNKFVHHYIQSKMRTDAINKTYYAITENIPEKESGLIDLPIYRPEQDSIERVIDDRGQESQTGYKVLETFDNAALVECKLLTGRTHQIRVHLKAIGNPLIGDPLYNPDSVEKFNYNTQALHAKKIEFPTPKKGKIELEIDLNSSLKDLLKKLRGQNE